MRLRFLAAKPAAQNDIAKTVHLVANVRKICVEVRRKAFTTFHPFFAGMQGHPDHPADSSLSRWSSRFRGSLLRVAEREPESLPDKSGAGAARVSPERTP